MYKISQQDKILRTVRAEELIFKMIYKNNKNMFQKNPNKAKLLIHFFVSFIIIINVQLLTMNPKVDHCTLVFASIVCRCTCIKSSMTSSDFLQHQRSRRNDYTVRNILRYSVTLKLIYNFTYFIVKHNLWPRKPTFYVILNNPLPPPKHFQTARGEDKFFSIEC